MAAVYAFAISWFAKGWELFEYNRLRPSDAAGGAAPDPDLAPDALPTPEPVLQGSLV
jgi:hypothetical protein